MVATNEKKVRFDKSIILLPVVGAVLWWLRTWLNAIFEYSTSYENNTIHTISIVDVRFPFLRKLLLMSIILLGLMIITSYVLARCKVPVTVKLGICQAIPFIMLCWQIDDLLALSTSWNKFFYMNMPIYLTYLGAFFVISASYFISKKYIKCI